MPQAQRPATARQEKRAHLCRHGATPGAILFSLSLSLLFVEVFLVPVVFWRWDPRLGDAEKRSRRWSRRWKSKAERERDRERDGGRLPAIFTFHLFGWVVQESGGGQWQLRWPTRSKLFGVETPTSSRLSLCACVFDVNSWRLAVSHHRRGLLITHKSSRRKQIQVNFRAPSSSRSASLGLCVAVHGAAGEPSESSTRRWPSIRRRRRRLPNPNRPCSVRR